MGMYDSVYTPCPKCGLQTELQSKSGECKLAVYTLDNAPYEVMRGINRHTPEFCKECKTPFYIEMVEDELERREIEGYRTITMRLEYCVIDVSDNLCSVCNGACYASGNDGYGWCSTCRGTGLKNPVNKDYGW
jgi:hypothetical protein